MKLIPQNLEIWEGLVHNPNFNRFDWSIHVTDRRTDDSIYAVARYKLLKMPCDRLTFTFCAGSTCRIMWHSVYHVVVASPW